ncbi:MAG TPA: PAS domain S-box protein [Gammaproteobacteria bacterium]
MQRMQMIDFLRVFEAAPVPFVVFDVDDYVILAANDVFLATVGAQREDVIGKRFDTAFPVDPTDPRSFENVRQLRASLDHVKETGKPHAVPIQRYAIPARNGKKGEFEERYWSLADSPIHDADGQLRYIVHRLEDVTDIVHFREQRSHDEDESLHAARADRLAAEVMRYAGELRSLNEHLRVAQRVANVGSWQLGIRDESRVWSDEMFRITGISRDKPLTTDALASVLHPADRDAFLEQRKHFMAGNDLPGEFEHRIIRPTDGEVRWVRERVEISFDEDNQPAWLFGTLQDITRDRHAEEQVRESEERFRLVAKAASDTIWDWDLVHDRVWWNEGVREAFGYTPQNIGPSSRSFVERIHPDDRARVQGLLQKAIRGDSDEWSAEYRFRRANGSYADVWMRGYVVARDQTGRAMRMVGGMNDISIAKEREVRLEEQAALLDKAQDAIIVSDIHSLTLFWNKGAERLYGWKTDEIIGRNKRELLEADPAAFDMAMRQLMETGEWSGMLAQKRKDGGLFTVEAVMALVANDAGKPTRILCINTDITERLALEEQLRQSQRLEAVGHLTGGIAHDFNNLLTVILGNAETIADRLPDNPELKNLALMTRDAATRGAELTHGLLAFARRQPLQPKAVDVEALVMRMENFLRRALPENIDIETTAAHDLWNAFVDPAQLESVMLNLALNAKDAMPEGGKLTVETANAELDDDYVARHADAEPGCYVMLAVCDTGTGIPPDILDRVFDPFFTTKEKGRGTGLGLSMAYGFVRQSGGHIRIESGLGQGTTVRVYLPRTRQAGASAAPGRMQEGQRGGGEKILVVEDDELVRMHAESQLEAFGYHVISAPDGPNALDIIRKEEDIDLLFTDVVMSGGMDGPALVEKARQIRPKLKVLYTSGYNESAIVRQGRLDEGVQLLQKPYQRHLLAQKVRDMLSQADGSA